MYYQNLKYLGSKSPAVYKIVKDNIVTEYKRFGFDKNKDLNIFFNDIDPVYITSKDHKDIESDLLTSEIYQDGHQEIIIFGLGNSLNFKKILKMKDKFTKIHIIEYKEVIDIMFRNCDLKSVPFEKINSLMLLNETIDAKSILRNIINRSNANVKFFILPQYQRLFKDDIEAIKDQMSDILKEKRSSLTTNKSYEKIWIYNSIINFWHVLNTPNFLDLKNNDFTNSVAMIVGAGPSLNHDIDYIREISKHDKCYIIAIGSAYKALMNNGVKMDLVLSYDPTTLNQSVMEPYFKNKVDAPICFGSSISFEAIKKIEYNNAFHLLISQDYFSQHLLQDSRLSVVVDAPSIVNIALAALVNIGFKNIIFAGQNLALLDGEIYAGGVNSERAKNVKVHTNIPIKDVFGNQIYTNQGFHMMKKGLELLISSHKDVNYINTTYKGADIEGAPYKALDAIEFNVFDNKIDFKNFNQHNSYDIDKAKVRFEELIDAQKSFFDQIKTGFDKLDELKNAIETKKINDDRLLVFFENYYNNLVKNIYYKVIISKLERTYISIFEQGVVEINKAYDLQAKHEMLYKKISTLLILFRSDNTEVEKLMNYISKWIKWEKSDE